MKDVINQSIIVLTSVLPEQPCWLLKNVSIQAASLNQPKNAILRMSCQGTDQRHAVIMKNFIVKFL